MRLAACVSILVWWIFLCVLLFFFLSPKVVYIWFLRNKEDKERASWRQDSDEYDVTEGNCVCPLFDRIVSLIFHVRGWSAAKTTWEEKHDTLRHSNTTNSSTTVSELILGRASQSQVGSESGWVNGELVQHSAPADNYWLVTLALSHPNSLILLHQ